MRLPVVACFYHTKMPSHTDTAMMINQNTN